MDEDEDLESAMQAVRGMREAAHSARGMDGAARRKILIEIGIASPEDATVTEQPSEPPSGEVQLEEEEMSL